MSGDEAIRREKTTAKHVKAGLISHRRSLSTVRPNEKEDLTAAVVPGGK